MRDADRCLTFEIVLPEDRVTIDKFGETGKLPAAVLADAKGTVLRRVESVGGRNGAPRALNYGPLSPASAPCPSVVEPRCSGLCAERSSLH